MLSTYVEFHQATNHLFDPYMLIVVAGASLGGIEIAILSRGIHSLLTVSGQGRQIWALLGTSVVALNADICLRRNI